MISVGLKPYYHINERGETVSYTHSQMVELARMVLADVGYSPRDIDIGETHAVKLLRQIFPRLSLGDLRKLILQALRP